MWQQLIAPIATVINGFGERSVRKKEIDVAKHNRTLEAIETAEAAEFLSDNKRTDQMGLSWKDEYITLLISIPLVLCFLGPDQAAIVEAGFKALEQTPDFYQYLVVGVFSVGAGVPLAGKTVSTIKSIMK